MYKNVVNERTIKMANQLYGGLDETKFRSMAKKAVVDYWNDNKKLVEKFGEISTKKVYVVWQVKVIQNSKAILGVKVEDDGMYFEFTYNGDAKEAYLDVYKKQTKRIVKY